MENFAIISSSKDLAGVNIRNSLIELFDFEKTNEKFDNYEIFEYNKFPNKKIKLYMIDTDLVYSEDIDKRLDADIMIFASKHRSKENTPSFAAHSIGNWGKAELGGQDKKLCPSSAVLSKNMLIELNKNAKETDYEITMEATHHGPFVEKPAVFVEIGSTEKEWNEKRNGEVIAKTIMDAVKNENKSYKIAFGIGGPHYCHNFNKIALNTDIALSHVCPKYALQNLDAEQISQAVQNTIEKVDFILLDWKGLGTEKQRIVDVLKGSNLEFKRTDQIVKD